MHFRKILYHLPLLDDLHSTDITDIKDGINEPSSLYELCVLLNVLNHQTYFVPTHNLHITLWAENVPDAYIRWVNLAYFQHL